MHLVEVAVQNIRGFTSGGRYPLQLGYFLLRSPSNAQPPIIALALAVLYADGRGDDGGLLAPGQKTGKAAYTLVGQDGASYSVVREMGGSGLLRRLGGSDTPSEVISQEAMEINHYLRGQVGLPPRGSFEQLLCLHAAQFPSKKPKPKVVEKTEAASKPSLAAAQAVAPAQDIPAALARVQTLEEELKSSNVVHALQLKVDELSSQLFEIETQLKSTEGLRERLKDARVELERAPTVDRLGLPPDSLERLARYPKAVAKRDESLNKLDLEREEDAAQVPEQVEPLTQDRAFWAGLVGGCFFLGLGLNLSGPAQYVTLLDIPAFGLSAALALRYVDDLQKSGRVSRKGGMFAAREKKILEEFQPEADFRQQVLAALKVESIEDVHELLSRRTQWEAQVAQLAEQMELAEAEPSFVAAAQQQEAVRAQLASLNAELAEKGVYVRDVHEVSRELARVKESIALAREPAAAPKAAAKGATAEVLLEDPTPGLLSAAADLLSIDVPAASSLLRERCFQYFSALTERRYPGVEWDLEGKATVVGKEPRPLGALPAQDVDAYYLALRLTVVEKASARGALPLLVEDLSSVVAAPQEPVLAKMLKHLGTKAQVVHTATQPVFTQGADGGINV